MINLIINRSLLAAFSRATGSWSPYASEIGLLALASCSSRSSAPSISMSSIICDVNMNREYCVSFIYDQNYYRRFSCETLKITIQFISVHSCNLLRARHANIQSRTEMGHCTGIFWSILDFDYAVLNQYPGMVEQIASSLFSRAVVIMSCFLHFRMANSDSDAYCGFVKHVVFTVHKLT